MQTLTFADVWFQGYDGHNVQKLFKLLPFEKKRKHRAPSNTIYLSGKHRNLYTPVAGLKDKNIIASAGSGPIGTRFFLTGKHYTLF